MSLPGSLHVVGTKIGGGAESFLARLVRALRDAGAPVRAGVRPQSPLASMLERGAPPVPVDRIALRNGVDLFSTWHIRRIVRRHELPIVQTYMGRATHLTRLAGTSSVHVARLGNFYRPRAYRHCDAWIVNTLGIRDWLLGHGFPPERVHHVYNFVDPAPAVPADALSEARERWSIPGDALVVTCAGRFEPIKGFDVLVEAFAEVPREIGGRRVVLLLVGSGSLEETLRERARVLGVEDRVRWTGWVADPAPAYQLADLVTFPARRDEPFGNVVLETWAHGRALLTTDFVGAREYVRAGADAAVVPAGDADALARETTALLGDPDRRAALASGGRARLEADFSRERIVGRYLELYRRLAAGRGTV